MYLTDGRADVDGIANRSGALQLAVLFGRFRPVQTDFEGLSQDILAGQSSALEPLETELDGSFELALALVDGMESVHNVPNATVHVIDVVLFQYGSPEQLDRVDRFVLDALGDGKGDDRELIDMTQHFEGLQISNVAHVALESESNRHGGHERRVDLGWTGQRWPEESNKESGCPGSCSGCCQVALK